MKLAIILLTACVTVLSSPQNYVWNQRPFFYHYQYPVAPQPYFYYANPMAGFYKSHQRIQNPIPELAAIDPSAGYVLPPLDQPLSEEPDQAYYQLSNIKNAQAGEGESLVSSISPDYVQQVQPGLAPDNRFLFSFPSITFTAVTWTKTKVFVFPTIG